MTDAERSLAIFNQAVEMKRKGRFDDALRLYVESINVYPADPNNMETFYAMGKIFYLKGDFSTAIKCYTVYNWRCVMKTMLILQDYCDMKAGDSQAQFRILDTYYNLATHWGWAKDEKGDSNQNKNEQIYRDLLMGGTVYSSLLPETKATYDKNDAFCRNSGYQYIFEHFENIIENPEQTTIEATRYTAEIFTIIARLPNNENHLNNNVIPASQSTKSEAAIASTKKNSDGSADRKKSKYDTYEEKESKGGCLPFLFVGLILFGAYCVGGYLWTSYDSKKVSTPSASVSEQKNTQTATKKTPPKTVEKENSQKNRDLENTKSNADIYTKSSSNDAMNVADTPRNENTSRNHNSSGNNNTAVSAQKEPEVDVDGALESFKAFAEAAGRRDYRTAYQYVKPSTMSYDDFVAINKRKDTFSKGITLTDVYPNYLGGVMVRFTKDNGSEGIVTMENNGRWQISFFNGVYSGI